MSKSICKIDKCDKEVRANGMCKSHDQKQRIHRDANYQPPWANAPEICIAEGCDRKATRKTQKMCEKHYYRVRRNGTVKLKDIQARERYEHTHGYWLVLDKEHPLADKSGYVYEHRKVLYATNPEMKCFHCGIDETWHTCHIDHLDDNKKNNIIDNLVISCPQCNVQRGQHKSKKTIRDKFAAHTYRKEKLCVSEWAERIGITSQAMQYRINNWKDKDRIFTESRGKYGPDKKTKGIL